MGLWKTSPVSDRLLASLKKALAAVNVGVVDVRHNRHMRIRVYHQHTKKFGNITLSASPSDLNVQRQRERQIRRELSHMGLHNPAIFPGVRFNLTPTC